jgi:hypothetical protein
MEQDYVGRNVSVGDILPASEESDARARARRQEGDKMSDQSQIVDAEPASGVHVSELGLAFGSCDPVADETLSDPLGEHYAPATLREAALALMNI